MHISEINIYPVKGLKGIALESAVVEDRGFRLDRRWLVTDGNDRFLTQREFPRLSTITVSVTGDGLRLTSEGNGSIDIPLEPETGDRRPVTIWQSVCDADFYPDEVNRWLSEQIGDECRLAYMPDDSRRSINPRFDRGNEIVSFADGYPYLVIGESSLDDLNSRLDAPLPMKRFRPNLVVSGSAAFTEDNWERIRIGDAVFRSTKPCERCVVTTVDPDRGEFDGNEPLRTLAGFRKAGDVMPERVESLGLNANGVLFGQNLVAETTGMTINVGDAVEVLA